MPESNHISNPTRAHFLRLTFLSVTCMVFYLLLQSNILHPLASLEWQECSSLPTSMLHPQAALLAGRVYLGGGVTSGMGMAEDAYVYIYDIKSNAWGGLHTPTYHYAVAAYQSQLVLLGGVEISTHDVTNQVWILGEECTWIQPLPPMLTKCRGSTAISVDHNLIVAGGHDDFALDVVQVYDGNQWGSWNNQILPQASYWMKSSLHEGHWYLAGGRWLNKKVFHTSLKSLISNSHDGETLTCIWQSLPDVPHGHSSPCSLGTELVAVGGEGSSVVHAYSSHRKSWVPVGNTPVGCDSGYTISLSPGELLLVTVEDTSGLVSRTFRGTVKCKPARELATHLTSIIMPLERVVPLQGGTNEPLILLRPSPL